MSTPTASRSGLKPRPVSPHLQVYRLIPTMLMSIVHRITGAAPYFGTLLVAWWLVAVATSEAYFDFVNGIYGSWFGRLVLFGFTWSLFHHWMGGIRHAIWDAGYLFDAKGRELAAQATLVGSIALTVIFWVLAYAYR